MGRAVCLLLLLLLPTSVVLKPGFEPDMAHGPLHLDREVSADKTVQLFLHLYRMAGPRIGCRLVDPADLLTLSGVRGLTAWNGAWPKPADGDLATVEALDRYLVPRGMSIEPERYPDSDVLAVSVVNLAGVERVSHASHMRGTVAYDAATGWTGYHTWKLQQLDAFRAAGAVSPENSVHLYFGMMLGYPDRAVLGYMGALDKDRNQQSIESEIAYTRYYSCGMPGFKFLPQDLEDPGIVHTIQAWGQLLQAIYEHPDMRRLDADPEFRAARIQLAGPKPRDCWWSDEPGRLGMVSAAEWQDMREYYRAGDLTQQHELAFRACCEDICGRIRAGATDKEVCVRLNQSAADLHLDCRFEPYTLHPMVELGTFETTGPHRDLYDAAMAAGHADWLPTRH